MLRLMQRLNYGVLFSAVGAALIIPFVYLLSLQLGGSQHDETFNAKEAGGVRYLAPTHEMMLQVNKRRLALVAQRTNQPDAAARLTETTSGIDRALQEVGTAATANGKWTLAASGEDRTTIKLNTLRNKWQTAREIDAKSATDDALEAQIGLAGEGNDFILNYLANFSNLILDPDLDSYWLMDAYVARLPALQDALTGLGSLATTAAAAGKLSTAERLRAAGLLEKARTLASELTTNFKTAFENNAAGTLRGNLEASVDKALGRVANFLTSLERDVIAAESPQGRASNILDATGTAIETVHTLTAEVEPQLLGLITKRVQSYAGSYRTGLITGFAALALLVYILLSFYFQVSGAATEKQREIHAAVSESEELRKRAEAENQQLNSNIMDLLMAVATAADGDLTVRAQVSEGALGNVADALNQMLESWNSVLQEMVESTEETQTAAARITEASNSLATGAARQVEEINNASKAVRAISDSVAQITENAKTAALAASRSQESAISGTESITHVITGMESLRANVQAGAKKIKNLGDRSMEITGIVGTIAKISEQTNMLALNAAIEAARAGEHGRGFSVVADQVRRLAERTEAATQEIRQLITGIQAETNESVAAIEEQTTAVETQAVNVSNGGQMLTRIQAESTQTAEIVADITTTATAQVDVADRAVRNMEFVTKIAEQARDGAQTTLAVSRALESIAGNLKTGVSRFKIRASDKAAPAPAAPAAAAAPAAPARASRRAPAGAR